MGIVVGVLVVITVIIVVVLVVLRDRHQNPDAGKVIFTNGAGAASFENPLYDIGPTGPQYLHTGYSTEDAYDTVDTVDTHEPGYMSVCSCIVCWWHARSHIRIAASFSCPLLDKIISILYYIVGIVA